jgi:uncharacterized membrane protein (UPF0136 family)
MRYNDLLLGVFLFTMAHILTFYQLNGQFIWKWFQKNEWVIILSGVILSVFYIWGTKYTVSGTGNLLWPARFIGFGVGMVIYSILVNHHFNEGINSKTIISLILCVILICIQIFWK